MYRSSTSILSLLFAGVAMLFYITYSTIGKMETNQANQLYAVNPGVDFGEGILNAPTFTGSTSSEQSDIAIPDYSPQNANYEVGSVTSVESRYANHSTNSSTSYSSNKSNNSSSSASSMSGAAIASNRKNSSSASQTANAGQMESVSSLTTDGSLSSSVNRQGANASSNGNGYGNGGRDPGGKDPKGPPIPIGSGTWTMIALAIFYALWKSKFSFKMSKELFSSVIKQGKFIRNY